MKYKNCFLGIPLPTRFSDAYKDLQVKLREIDPSLTLQDPKKLEPHITIYYLDEEADNALSEISKFIEESKDMLKGLTLKVGGMDFFQKQGYNVLFLDIVYPKELVIFQKEIGKKLVQYYKDNEILEFHPHMTVAEINTNRDTKLLDSTLLKLKEEFSKVSIEFPINSLVIYGINPSDPTESHKKLLTATI